MQFSRVGKHTIKCIISEEEIQDLGYSVEEIVTNSERTQEFMNHIFDLAEQEFETRFEMGIKTVQVEFHADHTLALTFSEHPVAEGMMEHLKDIIGGLLDSIPQNRIEEYKKKKGIAEAAAKDEQQMSADVVVMLVFDYLETAIRFSHQIRLEKLPESALYKYKDQYYLMMELSEYEEDEVKMLSHVTDEYVSDIRVGRESLAFMKEHAQVLLAENALANLRDL